MDKSTAPAVVLIPGPAAPVRVVLTCGSPECRHTFEPDPIAATTSRPACPQCEGWTFAAELVEPTPVGGAPR